MNDHAMTESLSAIPPQSHPDIEFTHQVTAFKRYLRIDTFRFRHRLFNGDWSVERPYDVVRRGSAIAILLYDPDRDCVVLIEQFRMPALLAGSSPWQLEPVGGMIDGNETPAEAAIREIGEESGLALLGEPVPIQRYLPSPSASDECLYLFCGRVDSSGATGVHGAAEEHEEIRVVVKAMAEIEALLDTGAVESCHTLISLQWLLRHRDRLRRQWGVE
jgi:ADP-ribose pyrophosphatase